MAHPMGAGSEDDLRLDFDPRVRLEFHGSKLSSDGGLLLYRELDEALGLFDKTVRFVRDTRKGKNGVHTLMGLLRQSVFGRLAGYEDVNDAERLALDPVMRRIVGGRTVDGQAASSSQMGHYGPPGLSHYTASKGAVIALTRGFGRELGDKNIQINAIAPGLTESESIQGHAGFDPARGPTVQSRSIKRDMLPEDLLGSLMYLITPDSDFVTDQTLNVDGGKVNL